MPRARRWHRRPKVEMPETKGWRCKRCGCTEARACPPCCWWVGPSLCSTCATAEELFIHSVAEKLGQLAELFSGIFKLPPEFSLKKKGKADIIEREEYKEDVRRTQREARDFRKVIRLQTKAPRAKLEPIVILNMLDMKGGTGLATLCRKANREAATVRRILRILEKRKLVRSAPGARPKKQRGASPKLYFRTK